MMGDCKSTLDDDEQHWISKIQKSEYYEVPKILAAAPYHIRNNKKIVMIAVQVNGYALEYASPALQNDKEVILAAVEQKGLALIYASPSLRKDKQVVLAAVKQDGTALKYASPSLRKDKEVVLAAVKENGWALQYVSPELNFEDMKEVALITVKKDPGLIKLVYPDHLKRDRDIMIAAGMFDSSHQEAAVRTDSKRIVLSTRFSLNEKTYSKATDFTAKFKKSDYIKDRQFVVYAPNAFDKKTCDPEWTNFDHPCRGTKGTCQYKYNRLTPDGHPTDDCCWRYSFRSQLQEANDTGGFMIQLVETDPSIFRGKVMDAVLGNGQRIELDMATKMGVKVFQVYCPEGKRGGEAYFEDDHIDYITNTISTWYSDNQNQCQDMSVKVIKQRW